MGDLRGSYAAIVVVVVLAGCTVDATYKNVYFTPNNPVILFRPSLPFCYPDPTIPYAVGSYFDMNGIRGTIVFTQTRAGVGPVHIALNIEGLDQFGEDERWGWHIHEYPINYALLEEDPCTVASVGGHYDPDNRRLVETYTDLCGPTDETSRRFCEIGDMAGRFGRLRPDQTVYHFDHEELDLYAPYSPIGRSIVIHRTHGFRLACANIEYDGHNRLETFIARFPLDPKQQQLTLQGDIILRRSRKRTGVSLYGSLYRVDGGPVGVSHDWNIRVGDCDDLKHIYGSNTYPIRHYNAHCNRIRHRLCYIGDLTRKCGQISSNAVGKIQFCCTDTQLGTIDWPPDNPYKHIGPLSLVIEDVDGSVLACSKFQPVRPKAARVTITKFVYFVRYLTIDILFHQTDPHDPTYIRPYIRGLKGDEGYLQIRERPVEADGNCTNLGPVYEPRPDFEPIPPIEGVIRTGDKDFLGELTYKLNITAPPRRSLWLPLFGPYTIFDRSLVVHDIEGNIIACGNIYRYLFPYEPRYSLTGYSK